MKAPSRVLVVLGTRPEAIKLVPVIAALRSDARFECRVCTTAQHRELADDVLSLANVVPDHDLDLMRPGQDLNALTAALLEGAGRVIASEQPDWVLVQGDTSTAMTAGLAAFHNRVRVGHIEAGLRSRSNHHPWPEEVNRKIVATLADLHFAPTDAAAGALRQENIDPATVHVTGNTGIDTLLWMKSRLVERPDLAIKLAPLERRFAGKRIVAVTCHRRESFTGGMNGIAAALRTIAARGDIAIVFPVHPNPRVREVMHAALSGIAEIALVEPLDYPSFIRLLDWCDLILTDSGGVQEEAPALGKPVLVLRETTERAEGIEAGTARLVGTRAERIVEEANNLLDDSDAYERMARVHSPYGDGRAAERIIEILARSHHTAG